MEIGIDWVTVVENAGIAIIAVLLIYFGFKLFELFIGQWKNSTDAMNKNTEAFTQLSNVFEKANQREVEFQEKALELMKNTNKKVNDIHDKIM